MKRRDVGADQLFELVHRGVDPARELETIANIHLHVKDAHEFARAYANYAQTVRELCSGNPEPVYTFLQRWPHRKAML